MEEQNIKPCTTVPSLSTEWRGKEGEAIGTRLKKRQTVVNVEIKVRYKGASTAV